MFSALPPLLNLPEQGRQRKHRANIAIKPETPKQKEDYFQGVGKSLSDSRLQFVLNRVAIRAELRDNSY